MLHDIIDFREILFISFYASQNRGLFPGFNLYTLKNKIQSAKIVVPDDFPKKSNLKISQSLYVTFRATGMSCYLTWMTPCGCSFHCLSGDTVCS